ncbi:unnamed protein product [[Candida] boidinii]|nr:unnamed protein product [[Candida] boidinii]
MNKPPPMENQEMMIGNKYLQVLSANNVLETAKNAVNESALPQAHKLAIEELQSMGFAKEEAIDALNKHDWSIDDATNYLLDAS